MSLINHSEIYQPISLWQVNYRHKTNCKVKVTCLRYLNKVVLKMVSIITFRKLALSFPEATEEAHFEKTSFRVKKKIFATYDDKNKMACIKLPEIDQSVFSSAAINIIYPVKNKWGKQGWTLIEMKKVNKALLADALITAFCEVAPKKLGELLKQICH